MITIEHKGSFKNSENFFKRMINGGVVCDLRKHGEKGVEALRRATPKDTGLTAQSWSYEIEKGNGYYSLVFKNSNIQNGVPIAIILQYGHATGNGGYVQGVDYINPALAAVFKSMADEAWNEVTKN